METFYGSIVYQFELTTLVVSFSFFLILFLLLCSFVCFPPLTLIDLLLFTDRLAAPTNDSVISSYCGKHIYFPLFIYFHSFSSVL